MSKKAHTEGPWRVLGKDAVDGIEYVEVTSGKFGPRYKSVARVGNDPDGLSEEDFSNACLIAAAPEMLEALEGLVSKFEEMNPMRSADYHTNCDCLRCKFDAARAALSKATGGE